jgi:hypothetical protein
LERFGGARVHGEVLRELLRRKRHARAGERIENGNAAGNEIGVEIAATMMNRRITRRAGLRCGGTLL